MQHVVVFVGLLYVAIAALSGVSVAYGYAKNMTHYEGTLHIDTAAVTVTAVSAQPKLNIW